MKKVVMIVAQEDFRKEELLQPKAILEQAGIHVDVASTNQGQAKGYPDDITVPIETTLSDISLDDYDGIVFIGGKGARRYVSNDDALKLAQTFYNSGKLTAAICIAPTILAQAGILTGKQVTVHPSGESFLEEKGILPTHQPVSQDGNIITASGPEAADAFGKALITALGVK